MILPAVIDLYLRRNDNPFYLRVNVTDGSGVPFDLTGYGIRMEIRKFRGQPGTPDLTVSTSGLGTTSRMVAGNGFWELFLRKNDITNLPLSTKTGESRIMYYDILFRDIPGNENAWYEGKVHVEPGVTA